MSRPRDVADIVVKVERLSLLHLVFRKELQPVVADQYTNTSPLSLISDVSGFRGITHVVIARFSDTIVGMMTASNDSLYTGSCTVTCVNSPMVRFGAIPLK